MILNISEFLEILTYFLQLVYFRVLLSLNHLLHRQLFNFFLGLLPWLKLLVNGMLLKWLQQIVQVHFLTLLYQLLTSCLHQWFSQVLFKPLQWHNLLFDCVLHYQPINVDNPCLADSMCSVHCLKIFHRVPIMFHENYHISSCQS